MKKLNFSAIVAVMFLFLTSVESYSFDVIITKPSMCSSLSTGYTVQGLGSQIQVKFHAQGGPSYSYWYAYINGNLVSTGYSYGDNEVTTNLSFPTGFCLNKDAILQINIYEIDHPEYMAIGYGYFRTYYNGQFGACSQYRAAVNGSNYEQWYGTQVWQHVNPCGWASGSSAAHRYRVDLYVNYEYYQNPVINIDLNRCNGFSNFNPNNQTTWAALVSADHTSAHFYTFVYYAYHNATSSWKWWPCSPQEAAVAFNIYDNVPPTNPQITSNLGGQYSGNLYRYQTAQLKGSATGATSHQWKYYLCLAATCTTSNWGGNLGSLGCTLLTPYYPNQSEWFKLYSNYNNQQCPSFSPLANPGPYVYVRAQYIASNGAGSVCTYYDIKMSTSSGGGCPWISVPINDSEFTLENNILHRSELEENAGIDINDKYLLQTQPHFAEDNTLSISITETEHDYNYFDRFKLYAVDHPEGSKIGVTENNDIVLYNYGMGIGDSIALIGIVGEHFDRIQVISKPLDGALTIYTPGENFVKEFKRREMGNAIIVPAVGGGGTIESYAISWYYETQDVDFVQKAIFYSGFTINELPLIDAFHSYWEEVWMQVAYIDQSYAELDSSAIITLKFYNIDAPETGLVRDYIFETQGFYVPDIHGKDILQNQLTKTMPLQYKLYVNYPNPFNPKTEIRYDLAQDGFVKITIYNVLGQTVEVLVNEFKKLGKYNVEFDGTNLASGIYFYGLEFGNYSEAKKMLLIK